MNYPLPIHKQVLDLYDRITGLPVSYVSLSDEYLIQLSSFYVSLKEGLKCFFELYKETKAVLARKEEDLFGVIYAELIRRISIQSDKERDKAALVHAIYRQSICVPHESYGEYGNGDWVYDTVFHVIDNRTSEIGISYDYAAFDLAMDTFHILGVFEPEKKELVETVLAEWEMEKMKDDWRSIPIYDVAQRLRIITAYNELSNTDLMNPVAQSIHLLETFTSSVLSEANADTLIFYRDALRNVYCYHTVHTEYFQHLEQAVKQLPGGFFSELIRGLLLIDRIERGMADLY